MPSNTLFKDALKNQADLLKTELVARRKALDDLLLADPNNISDFRKALIKHKDFWAKIPSLSAVVFDDSDNFLTADASSTEIRQAVAQLRVMSGLQKADKEVLINILSNNSEECRAYLASKPELGNFKQIPDWEKDDPAPQLAHNQPEPSPKNSSNENILSTAAIAHIKEEARDLLLLKLIAGSQNVAHLDALANAQVKDKVEAAVKELMLADKGPRYTTQILSAFSHPITPTVRVALDKHLLELKQKAAKESFISHVKGLSSADLSQQQAILETADPEFKAQLLTKFPDLADSDLNEVRGILGARYLISIFPKSQATLETVNAKDAETLASKIKARYGNHAYIEQALAQDFNGIKRAILQHYIDKDYTDKSSRLFEHFKKLDNATNLAEFKKALKDAGVTSVDWIQDSDLNEIKQTVRAADLRLETFGVLPFRHEPLAEVFANLSVKKQRELLSNKDLLRFLVNAQDINTVNQLLGETVNGASELVVENRRLAALRTVHNAELTYCLASIPNLHLSAQQINAINLELARSPDLTTDEAFITFVATIKSYCAPKDEGLFNRTFGLNTEGTAIPHVEAKGLAKAKSLIVQQIENNKEFLAAYTAPENNNHRRLLEVFLNLNKSNKYNANDATQIIALFNQAKTAQNFIEQLIPEPKLPAKLSNEQSMLKRHLITQLTPSLFAAIKKDVILGQFKDADSAKVTGAMGIVEQDLKTMQDLHKSITDGKGQFKLVEDIQPVHLFNPSFRGAAQAKTKEMQAHYQELSENCDAAVDQLQRNKVALEQYLEKFPKDAELDANLPQTERAKITLLRENLEKELASVAKNLADYLKLQEKLSGKQGILPAIDDAVNSRKTNVFLAEGVTRRFCRPEDISALKTVKDSTSQNTTLNSNVQGTISKFHVQDAIPPGQVAVYDVVKTHRTTNNGPVTLETRGRFIADPSGVGTVSLKENTFNKKTGGNFEILEFPQGNPRVKETPKQDSLAEIQLKHDRIHFSMTMVAEALANRDSPPTKKDPLHLYGSNKEEMRYLWTGLVAAGVDPKAIKIDRYGDNDFDPANEQGFFYGYKSDSLYEEFKKAKPPVQTDVVEELKTLKEAQAVQEKAQDKLNPAVKAANAALKGEFAAVRTKAQEAQKTDGPTPVSSSPSTKPMG